MQLQQPRPRENLVDDSNLFVFLVSCRDDETFPKHGGLFSQEARKLDLKVLKAHLSGSGTFLLSSSLSFVLFLSSLSTQNHTS